MGGRCLFSTDIRVGKFQFTSPCYGIVIKTRDSDLTPCIASIGFSGVAWPAFLICSLCIHRMAVLSSVCPQFTLSQHGGVNTREFHAEETRLAPIDKVVFAPLSHHHSRSRCA